MGNQESKDGSFEFRPMEMKEPKETDRLTVGDLNKKTDEVKGIVIEDIKKLEAREENLKELEDISKRIEEGGKEFSIGAKDVVNKKCCEHYKLWIILVTIVTVIIVILVVILVVTLVKLIK